MTYQPRYGSKTFVRVVAASLSPNLPGLVLAVGGWATELILLGQAQDNVFHTGGITPWVAVTSLAWFWYSMSWALWAVSRVLVRLGRRWAAHWLWIVLLAPPVCVYLASWVFYLRFNQFLSWEALRFTGNNLKLLWMYVRQTENATLAVWFLTFVTLFGGLVWFVRYLGTAQWPLEISRALQRRRRIVWYVLGLLTLAVFRQCGDSSVKLFFVGGINPVITMVTEELAGEAIEPCLDTTHLRALTTGGWKPPRKPQQQPNVIIVTIESLRHDVVLLQHQGVEVTPHLNRLARGGLHLRRAYAAAPFTSYSTASLFASIYPLWSRRPVYFHRADPWPKTRIYDLLKAAGYATAIISSQNESWGGMGHFLKSQNLDFFYDPTCSPEIAHASPAHRNSDLSQPAFDNLPDSQTAGRAIVWIRQQVARGSPFFLAVNFQSPHFPYHLPAGAERVFTPADIDFPISFLSYPVEKTEVMRNAYFNAVHESDRQLGRMVTALLDENQLDNTILVVSGDHGQAFHDKDGYVTHGGDPIEAVIRTACVVHAPRLVPPNSSDYPVELIDIPPTILGMLALPPHPNFQGVDFLAAERPPAEKRLLFFHAEQPLSHTDAVLLGGRWKYSYDHLTQRETLYDVVTDPNESNDVLGQQRTLAQRLHATLSLWRKQQLAYYAYPAYYQHYYPPPAPVWN